MVIWFGWTTADALALFLFAFGLGALCTWCVLRIALSRAIAEARTARFGGSGEEAHMDRSEASAEERSGEQVSQRGSGEHEKRGADLSCHGGGSLGSRRLIGRPGHDGL